MNGTEATQLTQVGHLTVLTWQMYVQIAIILLIFILYHTTFLYSHAVSHTFSNQMYIYAFSRRFYPKRLTVHSGYTCFITMCVPWESNPQPFALLTQCSTTEPQEHVVPTQSPGKLRAFIIHFAHDSVTIIYDFI